MSTTTTPTTPLKPDPFCGGKAEVLDGGIWGVTAAYSFMGPTIHRAAAEIRALRAERESHRLWLANATAQLDALRAERDDLLAVARMVLDCRDSHPATGNRVFLDYRDWEGTKEAARVCIARAEVGGA